MNKQQQQSPAIKGSVDSWDESRVVVQSMQTPEDESVHSDDDNSNGTNGQQQRWSLSMTTACIVGLLAVLVAAAAATPSIAFRDWIIWPLYQLLLRVVGVSLGVALGLGFAAHVYDQLTVWHERHHYEIAAAAANNSSSSSTYHPNLEGSSLPFRKSASTMAQASSAAAAAAASALLQDDYKSLMLSAGYLSGRTRNTNNNSYSTKEVILRGQVLRGDTLHQPVYGFDQKAHAVAAPRHAMAAFSEFWPGLPTPVSEKLAYLIENVLRDFVACWYSSVDGGCRYTDLQTNNDHQQPRDQPDGTTPAKQQINSRQYHHNARIMMYSTALYRNSPFVDALYESMVILFGNLATRVEHVNLFHIVLLQWTRVLAHTFKVYRTLRQSVLHKQRKTELVAPPAKRSSRRLVTENENNTATSTSNNNMSAFFGAFTSSVSEIQMTKEFLLLGKLHRAITFGLDVPALLFADASGKECGTPTTTSSSGSSSLPVEMTDDAVLADRLFNSQLLTECELDYNRVVGHRMVRALVTRQDFGAPIVSTLLTEVMGGCVLTPLMAVFSPDYLNSWIIKGLSSATVQGDDETAKEQVGGEEQKKPSSRDSNVGESGLLVDPLLGSVDDNVLHVETEHSAGPTGRPKLAQVETSIEGRLFDSQQSPQQLAVNDLTENASVLMSPSSENGITAGSRPATPRMEDSIISLLAISLIELQNYVDFDECRRARAHNEEINVAWDDPGCRTAVLRLVLVLELALTHGRCTYKMPDDKEMDSYTEYQDSADLDDIDLLDDSEQPVEVTLPEYESATLSQILMEMTGDIDAFEERVAMENTLAAEMIANKYEGMEIKEYKPSTNDQSTLRTLLAAWLHTGQLYRTVAVLVQAHATVLAPYYHNSAFLRSRSNANGFVRQLKVLAGVDILVDTMTVLGCPRLDVTDNDSLNELIRKATLPAPTSRSYPGSEGAQQGYMATPTSISTAQLMASSSTPRYLDFHRNESFASSLRSERERRLLSWKAILQQGDGEALPVCRSKGVSQEDRNIHRELHHIAKLFYTGTNIIGIRDAARRKHSQEVEGQGGQSLAAESLVGTDDILLSLITVETACPRRRIEVPDDDSSFLLRAQVSLSVDGSISCLSRILFCFSR
jgi:hypothetical protein